MTLRLGVLTSGGDCPGLNAAIRAVVRRARVGYGFEVIGIEDGGRGLMERRSVPLSVESIDPQGFDPMLSAGGTFLGTINRAFGEVEEEIQAGYREIGLDALIAIGGDGSMAILRESAQAGGWKMVAIPKTIDNDVPFTDRALGFDSAVRTVARGIEYLRTTGVSHDRVMVLETMGRHAGHLALHGGLSAGADAILIPEIPYTIEGLLGAIDRTSRVRKHVFAVVVVAEGVASPDGQTVKVTDSLGRSRYQGVGELVARSLETASDCRIEARATVLGHLQRGGPPTALDTLTATMFGTYAVDLVAQGSFDRMVALRGTTVEDVPLGEVVGQGPRPVDPDSQLVRMARAMGVHLGEV
jgi:ATP-dependent phosphofructokinase / diphosphate-dependent phosphofructokinase